VNFLRSFVPRIAILGMAACIASAAPVSSHGGQTGRANPLIGDGISPVVYYYDYSADGVTSDQLIRDKTDNTTDTTPLLNPHPFYSFLGTPPARDDLATTLVDGSSRLNEMGGAPGTPFQFVSGAGLGFMLPGARVFDTGAVEHGGITVTKNVIGHQDISDAGGFTFESYVRRTTDTTGTAVQQIWNPEGAHSVEITTSGNLQVSFRGLTAPIVLPVNSALPLGEWHHVMTVMDVVQPLPPGGDPDVDSLVANYSLYIDGQLVGVTPDADMISGSCCVLEFLDHEHGIGGSEFGATNQHFRGQLALTRLSLGALSVEQSLFLTPAPANDGDYNQNGIVDSADYVVWRKMFGGEGTPASFADGNGDGSIGPPDYLHWRERYGDLTAGGAGQASGVPEPSTIALVLMNCFHLSRRARRLPPVSP
jgi:hypothetical protein